MMTIITKFRGMKKDQQIKLIGFIIAIFIFIFILVENSKMSQNNDAQSRKQRAQQKVETKASESYGKKVTDIITAKTCKKKEMPPEIQALLSSVGREDPFLLGSRRMTAEQANNQSLYLRGVVWDQVKPMAIINDIIVTVGDIISEKEVVKIERERVILKEGEEEIMLRLGEIEQ